jgi:hypothetical protein
MANIELAGASLGTQMNERQKARLQLGLPEIFDHVALDAAYRASVTTLLNVPLDRREYLLRALNDARDRLDASLGPRPGTDLVTRSVAPLAVAPAISSTEIEKRAGASQRAVKAAVTRHIGQLARLRQRRFTISLVMGGLAAVGLLIRLTLNFRGITSEGRTTLYSWGISPDFVVLLTGSFTALGALFGIMGSTVKGRERYIQLQIEGVADVLTDRATLEDLLDEIGVEAAWTRDEFRERTRAWIEEQTSLYRDLPADSRHLDQVALPRPRMVEPYAWILRQFAILVAQERDEPLWVVATQIGPTDFANLVVAKTIETGATEEALIGGSDGHWRHGYRRIKLQVAV